jgi:hypothetical protein
VEEQQIGRSEDEEAIDFEEMMRDVKRQLESTGSSKAL